MKLAIVQLSDLHIQTVADPILMRPAKVVSAVKNLAPAADAYLVAVTGDVAYSGTKDQYKLAVPFFRSIKAELAKAGRPVLQVFIPGNHDLDFTDEPDTRGALLGHIRKHPHSLSSEGETAKQILSVHRNFFEFEGIMTELPPRPVQTQIAYSQLFEVSGKTVRAKCFNTAWMSTNPEVAATMVFPTHLIQECGEVADLEISLFHHPTNWLTPDNRRQFRLAVEQCTDLMLTGHEHETSDYRLENLETGTTQHVEGAVLQEATTGRSAFNVIIIDDEDESYEVFFCSWDGYKYLPRSKGVRPFARNRVARRALFPNTSKYEKALGDPGLPILHPRKHTVTLDDLFVYPALSRKDPDNKFQQLQIIDSLDVLRFVRSTPRLLIMGEETSGKTALAKQLYRDLRLPGTVPLLLDGRDIDGRHPADIRRVIRRAVEEQYGAEAVDGYFDLDSSRRILIIDDWNDLKYSGESKQSIVDDLTARFDRLIFFTSRLYALEELANTGPARRMFAAFEFCDIQELGKRTTGRLIEKWHALSESDPVDPREFHDAVARSEEKVATVIRKGILPTYPIFIIGLLQAGASPGSTTPQNAGAYGHIMEMLITDRLTLISKAAVDVGTMYTYLSRIAYFMFNNERAFLSSLEMNKVHNEYCHLYQLRLSEEQTVDSLMRANIICKEGDSFRFKYQGVYCYCVARYLFENVKDGESALRDKLNDMTDRLAYEDYTNIIMFYLYLSRDPNTIDRILSNATQIYAECRPANLGDDISFVNRLMKQKPDKILLPSTDISANRDEYRRRQDMLGEHEKAQALAAPDNRVPYKEASHELIRLAIGLQTLRVMGQVLRNFPGVLTAEPKMRLVEASYLLGLRILRRVFDLVEHQMQDLRTGFAEVFRRDIRFRLTRSWLRVRIRWSFG